MFRGFNLCFLLITLFSYGQGDEVWLHPNRGQWESRINYKVELQNGEMLVEPTAFTYSFHEKKHNHLDPSTEKSAAAETFRTHGLRANFLNATPPSLVEEAKKSTFYRNYFLSDDPQKWKSKIYSVRQVKSKGLYPGIDLFIEGGQSTLKYSWIVAPGADPHKIKWSYEGADRIEINPKGELIIYHSLGHITEGTPTAWITRDGHKKPVSVNYTISGKEVTFSLEGPGIFNDTLIIDPSLAFSTFTGSLSDNWGFTATPDPSKNLFAGGIVFGDGYPTMGAFDGSFNSGSGSGSAFDIGITKFNAKGTALLYSTYLGGFGNETPNSIVSAPNGELFVFGVTSSGDFPMAGASYDHSFNGGPSLTNVNELDFDAGADIFIARFSADGASLLASTFVGGTETDGLNTGNLNYNYGDPFRGDIIVDATGVYVTSVTNSSDFPTVNAAQNSLSGPLDAVVFKMNLGLSTMQWSTYLGGSGNDSGNSIERSSTGSVYIAGGTTSGINFPAGFNNAYSGGQSDGYVARLDGTSGALIAGTHIGTSDYDQGYFVQLDQSDKVYVLGQTTGNMPITAGHYSKANSGQFISSYSSDLLQFNWNTLIGSGSGEAEISPTAFLVSNCGDIYVAGWGGDINRQYAQYAKFSKTNGLPITSDGFQTTTTGGNFWIGVLSKDAKSLKYGTFMGGTDFNSANDHVDGGTSRFDKNGNIYHAVCGACGGQASGFTTTPGVWSPANKSSNCNLAAFKFELSSIKTIANPEAAVVCLPAPAVFDNNSLYGNHYYWNFGDNTTSTLQYPPAHHYAGPGIYKVSLLVTDTTGCFTADSTSFDVYVGDAAAGVTQPDSVFCPQDVIQLHAHGGAQYQWSPAQFLDDPTSDSPIVSVAETTTFTCVIRDTCQVDTFQVVVQIHTVDYHFPDDTTVCIENSVVLTVNNLATVNWVPPTYLDNPNSLTPLCTPTENIQYVISGTTADGCAVKDSVLVTVQFGLPDAVITDTLSYCRGSSAPLTVSGADSYSWSPPVDIDSVDSPSVIISSLVPRYYYCDFTNACGTMKDSVFANPVAPDIQAGNDTIVCPGDSAIFHATGGVIYQWPSGFRNLTASGSLVSFTPVNPGNYEMTGQDINGCIDTSLVTIRIYPQPSVYTDGNTVILRGETVTLSATGSSPGHYLWTPPDHLSCPHCAITDASPNQTTRYTILFTDNNGCLATNYATVLCESIVFIPNTFTPDGDKYNNDFLVIGVNISNVQVEIFNRWGELIYTGDGLSKAWDGTYQGTPCPDGVYTWKVKYDDINNNSYDLIGHVSLLR